MTAPESERSAAGGKVTKKIRIGVVAPAGIPDPEKVASGKMLLEDAGFEVVMDPGLQRVSGRYAGPATARFESLMGMLRNPDLEAVLCARGGYGCVHLLSMLGGTKQMFPAKAVMGFSDITALGPWLEGQAGLSWVHGPVLTQFSALVEDDRKQALRYLAGEEGDDGFSGIRRNGNADAVGPLFCANLTTLNHLLGTSWMPDLAGRILILEDVGEYAYRIDRMMWQFRASGILDQVAAIGLGTFTDCGGQEAVEEILLSCIPSSVPVLAGLPVGHGVRNRPVPVGRMARLEGNRLFWRGA